VIHVGNNGDVANTRIQIENSSELQIYGLLLLYYGGWPKGGAKRTNRCLPTFYANHASNC